jgi:hypothetical protein
MTGLQLLGCWGLLLRRSLPPRRAALILPVGFSRFPITVFDGSRLRCFVALGFLFLFVLVAHDFPDGLKVLLRCGMLYGVAFAYALSQFAQRGLGIWLIVWHVL